MRTTNRIVAALVAIVLLAAAVIGIVEIVLAALDKPYWLVPHADIASDLHSRTWENTTVRLVAGAVVIVGLLLLLVALKRGARSELALQADTDGVTITVTRRSVQSYLAGIAGAEQGVAKASATTSRTRAVVSVDSPLRDPGDLHSRVESRIMQCLDALRLVTPMKATVKIHREEG